MLYRLMVFFLMHTPTITVLCLNEHAHKNTDATVLNAIGKILMKENNITELRLGFIDMDALLFCRSLAGNTRLERLFMKLRKNIPLTGKPFLLALEKNTSLLSIHHGGTLTDDNASYYEGYLKRNGDRLSMNQAYIFRKWLFQQRHDRFMDSNAFKSIGKFLPELLTRRFDLLTRFLPSLAQKPLTLEAKLLHPQPSDRLAAHTFSRNEEKISTAYLSNDPSVSLMGLHKAVRALQKDVAVLKANQEHLLGYFSNQFQQLNTLVRQTEPLPPSTFQEDAEVDVTVSDAERGLAGAFEQKPTVLRSISQSTQSIFAQFSLCLSSIKYVPLGNTCL